MITDPVNVRERARPKDGVTHRVTRGAISAECFADDDEGGHYRDSTYPRRRSEDFGLRLSLTLPCNDEDGVVE